MKKEDKVIEADFSVEPQVVGEPGDSRGMRVAEADGIEKQAVNENPQCEIIVGMSEDGDIYYRVIGNNQNLVLMDGLHKYLGRVIDGLWDQRVGN